MARSASRNWVKQGLHLHQHHIQQWYCGLINAKAHKSGWELSEGVKNGELRISYDLKPGDRVWMVPSVPLQAARIRIERPRHWSVASRYDETDGLLNIHPLPTGRVSDELQTGCMAFGPFNEERKVVGTTAVRVFNPRNCPEST